MRQVLIGLVMAAPAWVTAATPMPMPPAQDDSAQANSTCAALYAVFREVARPELVPVIDDRYRTHLRYARGLHLASEPQVDRLQRDIEQQRLAVDRQPSPEAAQTWLRARATECIELEFAMPQLIRSHRFGMAGEP